MFEVGPNGQVLKCPGKQFDDVLLKWHYVLTMERHHSLLRCHYNTQIISAFNTVGYVIPLQVPFIVITFSIPSTSPLISVLSVNSTTANLNGTIIECTEQNTAMDRSNEAIFHVINTDQGIDLMCKWQIIIWIYVDFSHLAMIRHHSEEFWCWLGGQGCILWCDHNSSKYFNKMASWKYKCSTYIVLQHSILCHCCCHPLWANQHNHHH